MYKKEIGNIIPDLKINGEPAPYGVLNEKAVRATAGLLFAIGFFTMLTTVYTQTYTLLTIVVIFFFLDFLVKVLVGPNYSPISRLGAYLVRNQEPEWVGAIQKRFAWTLGLIMASSVIILAIIYEIRGFVPLALCSICLVLMWMESAIGVCVGCNIYAYLEKKGVIEKKQFRPACPGGACSIKKPG